MGMKSPELPQKPFSPMVALSTVRRLLDGDDRAEGAG
jgi:hypothetical protein